MKPIVYYLMLFIVLAVALELILRKFDEIAHPCLVPLTYRVGHIDSKFEKTELEVRSLLLEAEVMWEQASGQNLYQYDPESSLAVNFIYDYRQKETDDVKSKEGELDDKEKTQAELKEDADGLRAQLESDIQNYESEQASYNRQIEKFNKDVGEANDGGGASKKDVEKFNKRQSELELEAQNLRAKYNSLQTRQQELQGKIDVVNRVVGDFNSSARDFNEQYGGSREFEKGVYDGKQINIYQFQETNDLVQVLAHELGHARGLDHVFTENSLMYAIELGSTLEEPQRISTQDLAELAVACKVDPWEKLFGKGNAN